jgi:hypothetical protein
MPTVLSSRIADRGVLAPRTAFAVCPRGSLAPFSPRHPTIAATIRVASVPRLPKADLLPLKLLLPSFL